jgi:hypothetical protein
MKNPKLVDSNIIDCIPQEGECPLGCIECYYNSGRFYRELKPLIPTIEESKGKIIRVNSGHDSNLEFEDVISKTCNYDDVFYNTSIPRLRFNTPTILTINGRDTDKTFIHITDLVGDITTLMAVRFRLNTWNVELCEKAIEEYEDIPFLLTDMRYYNSKYIPDEHKKYYQWKKHILNSYYCLNEEGKKVLMPLLAYQNVYWCANPFTGSSYCRDCRLCEHLYIKTKMLIEGG